MLDYRQQDVINLIRSAITNQKLSLSDNSDFEYIYNIAKKHQIFSLLFNGLVNCGITNNEYYQKLFVMTCSSISVSERQMFEINKILELFEQEKIDYMPLKGIVLKPLYPKPDMRIMGDADILIKLEDYEKIRAILKNLGFAELGESDHELSWSKSDLYLEMHKCIMPQRDKKYYSYFGDGWDLALKADEKFNRYVMSDEMLMIYLFVHFTKHYSGAGIGIKHMVDLWVYLSNKPDLNQEYIASELKKLNLLEFYNNIVHTLNAWFGITEFNEKDEFITNVIFNNGVFGNFENVMLSTVGKTFEEGNEIKNTKFKRILNLVFPPYSSMKYIFPILKKAPILLPLFWIVRVFRALFFRRGKILAEMENINNISNEKVDSYIKSMSYVGLNAEE